MIYNFFVVFYLKTAGSIGGYLMIQLLEVLYLIFLFQGFRGFGSWLCPSAGFLGVTRCGRPRL